MPRKVKRGPKGPRGCSDSPGAPSVQAMEVKDLLCDSDKEDAEAGGEQHRAEGQLKINKAFAEKYDQRKRTELLNEEASSTSSEDEDGSLLTPRVERKLLKVLHLIKSKDPKIYDPQSVFFKDSDFLPEEAEVPVQKERPLRYQEMLAKTLKEEGAEGFVQEEEHFEQRAKQAKGSSYEEDLASLRKSFLQAAEEATEGNREAGEGEELLELKCKGMKEQEQEDTDYRQFLNAKHAQRGVASDSVLARFWADDGNLNANERFLRDYIVNEAWREDKAQAQWQGMTDMRGRCCLAFFVVVKHPRYDMREEEKVGQRRGVLDGEDDSEANLPHGHPIPASGVFLSSLLCASPSDASRLLPCCWGWLMTSVTCFGEVAGVDDEEDDEQLEKAEAFEASYNFRFEEEGGTNIQGHPRVISDSVRQKDDKRKRAREKKQKQKEEEQLRRREELKRLKSLKREEIAEKIRQIQQVGGLDEATVSRVLDLGGAFDSEAHDVEMQKLFGEDYDAQDEEGDCLAMPEACADILSTAHETEPEALTKKQRKLLKLESKRKRQGQRVEGYAKDAEAQVVETEDAGASEQGEPHSKGGDQDSAGQRAEEGTEAEWWMCDGCGIGIRGGKKRFDCTTCENFTLCKPCFRNVRHPHQLVRKTVPPHCNPPKDFVSGALHCPPPAELSELLDEYFQLDYEDIIGGDLPTRFKYRKVQPNNYGMTTEEILNSTDAELNSKVSLKKLAPYREQEHSGNTAEKPWRQQWRSKARESQPTDSKLKKRERTDRAMTPFGVRKDRLAAYDA
ncbi:krr1 zinc finger-containing protein [Cyclospora cayetanensis]|uniref:Krr1 zinc finger-containing protein n=1 Tax=Cyclospora cayetanensis TaxID=88456 RepID=A0A1D3CTK7_9EIME|nr:krr1 zinc finger-containing protein [Cyclospora cayetanensis]